MRYLDAPRETFPDAFDRYVGETTGLSLHHDKQPRRDLPAYLDHRYRVFGIEAVGALRGVVILLRDPDKFSPASFEKHLRMLLPSPEMPYVLVAGDLAPYVRNRLVERRIPFVVPGRQIHWPDLGIAIRKRAAQAPAAAPEAFSPATQAFLVALLARRLQIDAPARILAHQLGYTPMTMSRVMNELEGAGVAVTERRGHARWLQLQQNGRELWQACQDKLRSPVLKSVTVWQDALPAKSPPAAGESALSLVTMLNEPRQPVYAVDRGQATRLKRLGLARAPEGEPGSCALQVWSYDPAMAAKNGAVDPFSLYLSLRDNEDDRVRQSLEELMETVEW